MATTSARPRPANYARALKMATAIRARGHTADPAAVVRHVSEQVIRSREHAGQAAKNAIRTLWRTVDPYNDEDVRQFAARAAKLMTAAQAAVARAAAAGEVKQLAAVGIKVTAAPSHTTDVRAGAATIDGGKVQLHRRKVTVDYKHGDSAHVHPDDMTNRAIFTRPAETYRYAASKESPHAEQRANNRIDSLVDDNLMLAQRLAQQEVLAQAADTSGEKITGYRRIIHPEISRSGTCGMCIVAARRIYHIADLMPIHDHCQCTIAPVTKDHDPGDDANQIDLKDLYEHAGGNTKAHLKRTRYQIDDHGELGPTLVPKKPYTPRSEASRRIAAGERALVRPTESITDVGRRNVHAYEDSLHKLLQDGVPADSSKIAYLRRLIDKFGQAA